jgi:hypothetical protein
MTKQLTIEQIEDFAELANGYQDDFGKWLFDDSDDLGKFADIVLATTSVEMNNLNTMIQMLKTDLAAADAEISNLRGK